MKGHRMNVAIRNPGMPAMVAGALLAATAVRADAQERSAVVDTLESGRIVVSNPDTPQTGPQGVPMLVEALRIGSVSGTCDAFGDVNSIAVDGDGRIYVADRQLNEISVFSAQGECVRTIGRSGEGPGEFGWLAGIIWQPSGHLWTIDATMNRFTVFDSLGNVHATHPSPVVRAAALPWPLWGDSGGNLHFYHPSFRGIVKYAPGPGLDSLGSFLLPEFPRNTRNTYTQEVSGANVRIANRSRIPYTPRYRWTVNPDGNIWVANTSVFAIHELTYAGDTLRTVRLDREAPRLEGSERDSIASAAGIPERRLPARKYAIERIRTSPDGWVWIETERRATRAWDVFDELGVYVGRVASPVPIEKEPFPVFGAGTLTGVTLGEMDVPYVVQLRIVR